MVCAICSPHYFFFLVVFLTGVFLADPTFFFVGDTSFDRVFALGVITSWIGTPRQIVRIREESCEISSRLTSPTSC